MQKHEVCTQMPIKSDKAHKNLVNIAHFDLYRLNTAEDFFALGFWQDLFEPQQITFIEWPEILFSLLEEITQTNKVFLVNLSANKEHFEKSRHLQFFEFINKSL